MRLFSRHISRHISHHILLGLLVSTAGGALCAWLHTPLPWIIGPLLAMALCNFSGAKLAAPPLGRECGQFLIAIALGLYFTPAVAAEVFGNAWLLLTAAFGALGIGVFASRVLIRFAGVDSATAFFASIPGGATEMANLGDRFGAAVDRVAIAHSLRILIVVCTIPVMLTLVDIHGADDYRPVRFAFSISGLAVLGAIALSGGAILQKIRFPNPWMMGPLLATMIITATGGEWSSLPNLLSNSAQVLIGCALGARFSRAAVAGASRFVVVVLITIVLMILLSVLLALVLAQLSGTFLPSMILAAAPGGIAEMAITAQALQLGVALVTAAHVTRVFIIVSLALPMYRLLQYTKRPRK